MNETNRCPACQARFRSAATCSRCGADLGRLMLLAVEAWRLREAARTALVAGEFARGFDLAARAQELQSTRAGESLQTLGKWLAAEPGARRS